MNPSTKQVISARLTLGVSLLLLANAASAQHYPAGAEGIRAATLPPPGVYLRDYNFGSFSDEQNLGPLINVSTQSYVNAPRLIWMTPWDILGVEYGLDVIVPFGYAHVKYIAPGNARSTFSRVDASTSGLSDIQLEPLLLSWHIQHFDFAAGYALWIPTGGFDVNKPVNLGAGFYTHMLTAGVTWYPDNAKTWAVSLLNRYEINTEQDDTHITPGQHLTMEWGLSKTVYTNLDLGFVGFYQQQTTSNSGPGTTDSLGYAVAVGPEVSGVIPKIGVTASLRYLRQFEVNDGLKGNIFSFTLTKRF